MGTVCPENWIERSTEVEFTGPGYTLVCHLGGELPDVPRTSLLTGLLLAEAQDNGAEDSGDTEDELRR